MQLRSRQATKDEVVMDVLSRQKGRAHLVASLLLESSVRKGKVCLALGVQEVDFQDVSSS